MIGNLRETYLLEENARMKNEVTLLRENLLQKQRYYSRLSHEMRNPVSGITGLLYILENTALDPQQKELVQAMKSSADSLYSLLNDSLEFCKMESGKVRVVNEKFNLMQTLQNIYVLYKPKAQEKNLSFSYKTDPLLPRWVIGDEKKLIQILSNLISNAIKFTNEGFVTLRVCLENISNEGPVIRFKVLDSGRGISLPDQKLLFREFSQVGEGVSEQNYGIGLGLSICKQLITLMEGTYGVRSNPGQGSNFWFSIGFGRVDQKEIKEKGSMRRSFDPLNISVLLVEDMALSRKMTKLVLEKMGCKVKYAENGEQAIDIIVASNDPFDDTHNEPIDIILMDQNMPGISGVATLQYLRKLLDDLPPVIALTADDSLMRDSMFGEYGFSDFLLKPFTPEHLYASVKNCMEISKAKRKRAAAEPLPFNIKQYTKSKAG